MVGLTLVSHFSFFRMSHIKVLMLSLHKNASARKTRGNCIDMSPNYPKPIFIKYIEIPVNNFMIDYNAGAIQPTFEKPSDP